MKFLDAKRQSASKPENKMLTGTRPDQGGKRGKDVEPTEDVFASENARALAQELGIDPATVQGSGKDGRITAADVRKAAEPKQPDEDIEL